MVAAPGKKKKKKQTRNLIWSSSLYVTKLTLSVFAISPSLLLSQRSNNSSYKQTHPFVPLSADAMNNNDNAPLS